VVLVTESERAGALPPEKPVVARKRVVSPVDDALSNLKYASDSLRVAEDFLLSLTKHLVHALDTIKNDVSDDWFMQATGDLMLSCLGLASELSDAYNAVREAMIQLKEVAKDEQKETGELRKGE